jgi:hypothetical protein
MAMVILQKALLYCWLLHVANAEQTNCSNAVNDETSLVQTISKIKRGSSREASKRRAHPRGALTAEQTSCLEDYADELDQVFPKLGDQIRAHPGTVTNTSDRLLLLGVGSGATGTSSLAKALIDIFEGMGVEKMVAHSQHSPLENCKYSETLYGMFQATPQECFLSLHKFDYTLMAPSVGALLDAPTFELFIDFFLAFPKAVYVLTDRDPTAWARARAKHLMKSVPYPMQEPCGRLMTHPGSHPPISQFAAIYAASNRLIQCMVPKEKIFEINVFDKPTNGLMGSLAEYLRGHGFGSKSKEEVATLFDEQPYPHINVVNIPAPVCPAFLRTGYPKPPYISKMYRDMSFQKFQRNVDYTDFGGV